MGKKTGEITTLLTLMGISVMILGALTARVIEKRNQDIRSNAQIQPTLTPIPTFAYSNCTSGLGSGETPWECVVDGVFNCAPEDVRKRFDEKYCCGKDQWLYENANNYGRPGECGGQPSDKKPTCSTTSCNIYPTSSPLPTLPPGIPTLTYAPGIPTPSGRVSPFPTVTIISLPTIIPVPTIPPQAYDEKGNLCPNTLYEAILDKESKRLPLTKDEQIFKDVCTKLCRGPSTQICTGWIPSNAHHVDCRLFDGNRTECDKHNPIWGSADDCAYYSSCGKCISASDTDARNECLYSTPTPMPSPTPLPTVAIPEANAMGCLPILEHDKQENQINIILLPDAFNDLGLFLAYADQVKQYFFDTNLPENIKRKVNFYASRRLDIDYAVAYTGHLYWRDKNASEERQRCGGYAYMIITNKYTLKETEGVGGTAITTYSKKTQKMRGGKQSIVLATEAVVASHELGHALVGLFEEYDTGKNAPQDEKASLNCAQKVGNDIPQCKIWEDNYTENIGCFPTCQYSDWFRPSYLSIMSAPWTSHSFNGPSLDAWQDAFSIAQYNCRQHDNDMTACDDHNYRWTAFPCTYNMGCNRCVNFQIGDKACQ